MRYPIVLIATSLLVAAPARAGSISYSGMLKTTDPTFDRPLAYIDGTQSDFFLGYSSSGDNVYYNKQPFYVTASDDYTVTVSTNLSQDHFILTLYQAPFVPTDSSLNYLSDFRSQGILTYPLDPGTQYDLVISGVDNGDTGDYTVTISSTTTTGLPILGSVVPEPSTLTLLGTGVLILLGYSWRRRRRVPG